MSNTSTKIINWGGLFVGLIMLLAIVSPTKRYYVTNDQGLRIYLCEPIFMYWIHQYTSNPVDAEE